MIQHRWRLPNNTVDQYIYFYAVDATDRVTPETGLTGFTVSRARNGGTATIYTTPTINETDSVNMPGVYALLVDEDTVLDAGDDSQSVALHISHASIDPVFITLEIYSSAVDYRLDHLLSAVADGGDVADNSIIAQLVSKNPTADWDDFSNEAHSLQKIGDDVAQNLVNLAIGVFVRRIGTDDTAGQTAAQQIAKSAQMIVSGTVDTTAFTPTQTKFQADDITEATADHFNGRVVIFMTGPLKYQVANITDYALVGGRGQFTTSTMTEAPQNNNEFIIV